MEDHIQDTSNAESTQPGPSGAGLVRGFLGTAKAVLLSPRVFFPQMPVEGGLTGPYVFFLLCTSLFLVVSLALNLGAGKGFDPKILLIILVALVMPFVSAALLNLFLTKLLGATGSYEASFRVVCYASAVNLVTWIPIIGILGQIYEIYLSALGLSIVYRTGMGRALLAVVCTAFTIFLAVTLVAQVIVGS